MEMKRIVRGSLERVHKACGGPADVSHLLGPQFDEQFLDLARRYWLDLSAAERRKSWES